MVFSSLIFIFRFLPVAFVIYYLTPIRWKNLALLLLSLFFYSWGEVRYLPILLVTITLDYCAARFMVANEAKRGAQKGILITALVINIGLLGVFKYSNFFLENINQVLHWELPLFDLALPLGISFYTFQAMSYLIDVYRKKAAVENNFIRFGAFVALFPQLIAGPIVRYTDISKELRQRTIELSQVREGVELFIFGLASKVLLANSIGVLWTEISGLGYENISSPLAWLGILAFSFQIYFDFSGYSLMAIGLRKMLGFKFTQNFNYPYISRSITEFWRRWHMTLGSWFREYLYIPLGGNRKGKLRTYCNLFLVWAVTGFWHGASWNFVAWGLFFFVTIGIEKAGLLKWLESPTWKARILSRIYFIFLTLIGWSIFAITDFSQLGIFVTKLFSFDIGADVIYYLRNYFMVFFFAAIFSTPALKNGWKRFAENGVIRTIILLFLFLLSVAYIVDSSYNPFLYFRF